MKTLPACLCGFVLLVAGLARADDPFQTTIVSTLQHGRLEVAVGMTLEMASLLVEDPADPESSRLDAGNFAARKAALEKRVMNLYEVTAGQTVLTPQGAIAALTPEGGIKCVVLYPQPAETPLRFRIRPLPGLPRDATVALDIRDQNEKSLGQKLLSPGDPGKAELSISPALPATPPPPMRSVPAPIAESTFRVPGFGVVLGIGVVLAVAAAAAVLGILRKTAPKKFRS